MTCVIRTRTGALLAVDPVDLDFYCQVQLQNGVWEEDVLGACLRAIRPGDVFYDIGANAGIVAVDVARTFGERVTVHAFEPQPTLAASLATSIALTRSRGPTFTSFSRGHVRRGGPLRARPWRSLVARLARSRRHAPPVPHGND